MDASVIHASPIIGFEVDFDLDARWQLGPRLDPVALLEFCRPVDKKLTVIRDLCAPEPHQEEITEPVGEGRVHRASGGAAQGEEGDDEKNPEPASGIRRHARPQRAGAPGPGPRDWQACRRA